MERKRKLRPEAKYHVYQKITLSDIERAYEEGSSITGEVVGYDIANETVEVDLGNGNRGVLPWKEATIYEFTYPNVDGEATKIPRQVIAILYRTIRVKIAEIRDGQIILSRKKNMMEAVNTILTGAARTFEAVVIGKYRYGVFYDIGEGVIAFCHITEFSDTFVSDVGSWISLGEQHSVVLTDTSEDYKFRCSRKLAYLPKYGYESYKRGQIILVRVSEKVYQDGVHTGYFVELNPVVMGIADISDQKNTLKSGDKVVAVIKSIDYEKKKVRLRIIA